MKKVRSVGDECLNPKRRAGGEEREKERSSFALFLGGAFSTIAAYRRRSQAAFVL